MLVKLIQYNKENEEGITQVQTIIWDCDEVHYGTSETGEVYLILCKGTGKEKSTMLNEHLPEDCVVYIMNDRGDTVDKINHLNK